MDINDIRGMLTAVMLFAFIGLCIWAWSRRRDAEFTALANLPLEEDDPMANNERERVR